jgi:hypothetical protein
MNLFRRLLFMAGVAAMLSLFIPSVLAASYKPSPIQNDEYWEFVRHSRDVISRIDGSSNTEIKKDLIDLADQWQAITLVEVDGELIPLDNSYLIKLLRAEDPQLQQIDGILAALQAEHEAQNPGSFSTSDLNSLHTILARPEFAWAQQTPNPLTVWIQKLLDAFNALLNRIFGNEPISISTNTLTLAVIASILLIIVLIFVYRTLFNDFIKETQLGMDEEQDGEPLTSEAAFDRAQILSKGGDYRSAVRYLYLSSLLLMDERGILRYDRSKTNREYLRSVANSPELAKPLGDVIEVFDNVWYGYHSLEEETFKKYSDRVEELKEKKS